MKKSFVIYNIFITVLMLFGCSGKEVKEDVKPEIKAEPEITQTSCTFNLMDGECQNFSNGSQTCWKGDCTEGDCTLGKGKKEFKAGSFYEGFFKKGIFEGAGVLVTCDGAKFDGIFKSGYLEKGTMTDADGSIYNGSLKNNLYDGKGKLTTSSGDSYDGIWKKGKKNGKFSVLISEEKSNITYQDDEDIQDIAIRKREEAEEKKLRARMAFWSEDQGRMEYDSAKDQCKSIGMRLPSISELKAAYRDGTTNSWGDDVYWSSTPYQRNQYYRGVNVISSTWYNGLISDGGGVNQYPPSDTWAVRCHK